MTGTLYVITNKVNGKQYVGKTYDTIENRFKGHIQTSKRNYALNRPLYKAFNKYGINSFEIKEIGKYVDGKLEQAEIKLIEKLGTFKNGYNLTLGGDGVPYLNLDEEEVLEVFTKEDNVTRTAEFFNCTVDTIRKILRQHNVHIKQKGEAQSIKVRLVEKNLVFNSQTDAAKYLLNNGYTKTKNVDSIASGISKVLVGFRKTCYGLHWKKV